ncbi:hypothetical protein C0Q70_14615 [Pomacea canaliculata]|uniref:Uncharacterized protein n=1 Tax=Pomacea canaliculata TaxID=400727 RepID=A0A2T7NSK0_POMCA|nr:hypothetical protein C0Q70_14615 [Pomacea canaliculata]
MLGAAMIRLASHWCRSWNCHTGQDRTGQDRPCTCTCHKEADVPLRCPVPCRHHVCSLAFCRVFVGLLRSNAFTHDWSPSDYVSYPHHKAAQETRR